MDWIQLLHILLLIIFTIQVMVIAITIKLPIKPPTPTFATTFWTCGINNDNEAIAELNPKIFPRFWGL